MGAQWPSPIAVSRSIIPVPVCGARSDVPRAGAELLSML
jgi:hypothetical protein